MSKTISDWIQRIDSKPIPVLGKTIADLKRVTGDADAHIRELTDVVERDPGLMAFVLRMLNSNKPGRMSSEVTSVQQALMMMGTDTLNRLPGRLPNLEQTLQEPARTRLLKTFSRTYHAARQAVTWAIQRRDMTPDEVFAATQLHFIGEMGLAVHAPQFLDEIDRLCIEQHLPSEEAQYIVLGFSIDELTRELARHWKLPQLVIDALQPENARYPRAYGIMLAVQLGRHAAIDWYGAKTRDLEDKAAEWLGIDVDKLVADIHRLAAEVARVSCRHYQIGAAAGHLLYPAHDPARATSKLTTPTTVEVCLMPQPAQIKQLLVELNQPETARQDHERIIELVTQGIHHGLGMNRVVFARLDSKQNQLVAKKIIGANNDPIFSRFIIALHQPHLFSRLMEKTQAILINNDNRHKIWSLVPDGFKNSIKVDSFVAMSVFVNNQPYGLFYADRHSTKCQIDEASYQDFKAICSQAGKVLDQAR